MVAIRPTRVEGQAGQKFIVTKRFSGDGFDFVIGDVIVAKPEWIHKVPALVDQRFISPFLSADDEAKTPVNGVIEVLPEEVPFLASSPVTPVASDPVVVDVSDGTEQSEIDALADSLL